MEYLLISGILFLALFGIFKILEIIANVAPIVDINYIKFKFKLNTIGVTLMIFLFIYLSFKVMPDLVHKYHWFDFFLPKYHPISESETTKQELVKVNELGDAFGGTLGPFIAFIGAVFTGLAFWAQYKANQQQKRDLERERFENRYFELIRLHKANVDELKLNGDIKGRECFSWYFKELKLIYKVLGKLLEREKSNIKLDTNTEFKTREDWLKIAYEIFFMGAEFVTNNLEGRTLTDKEKKVINFFELSEGKKVVDGLISTKNTQFNSSIDSFQWDNEIVKTHNEFESRGISWGLGSTSSIGHYYRHLFLVVKYVVDQPDVLFNENDKLYYLGILRAQLSNVEQLMLYYDAVGGKYGHHWIKNEYLTKYKLIHNMPFSLADFGIKPNEQPKIKESMEYWKAKRLKLFEQDED